MGGTRVGEWDDGTSITATIVQTVAAVEDVDPLELTPPLGDVVDIDAIETLFSEASADTNAGVEQLTFRYRDCRVTISGSKQVYVERIELSAE